MAAVPHVTACPRYGTAQASGQSCSACALLVTENGSAWRLAGLGRRLAGAALFVALCTVVYAVFALTLAAVLGTLEHSEDYPSGLQDLLVTASLLGPTALYLAGWLAPSS